MVRYQRIISGTSMLQVPLDGSIYGVCTYGFSNGTTRLVVVAR